MAGIEIATGELVGTTIVEKIQWMREWCMRNGLTLELNGECGFGRECVGIIAGNNNYPDYMWYDDDTYERIDNNGDVWTPKDAYHKHPCVAVLGRDKDAIIQLYDWLKWFDANNFKFELLPVDKQLSPFEMLMGKNYHARMIKVR